MFPFLLVKLKPPEPEAQTVAEDTAPAAHAVGGVGPYNPMDDYRAAAYVKTAKPKPTLPAPPELGKAVGPFITDLSVTREHAPATTADGLDRRFITVATITISTKCYNLETLRKLCKDEKNPMLKAAFDDACKEVTLAQQSMKPPNPRTATPIQKEKYQQALKNTLRNVRTYENLDTDRIVKIELSPRTARMLGDREDQFIKLVVRETEFMLAGLEPPRANNSRYWDYSSALAEEIREKMDGAKWLDSGRPYKGMSAPVRAPAKKKAKDKALKR